MGCSETGCAFPYAPLLRGGPSFEKMDELLTLGRQLGLSPADVRLSLRLGRPLSDCNWCIASDVGQRAQEIARDVFEVGRLIEYHCYDDHGHNQGRAVLRLLNWAAEHGLASDAYYDWYAQHELQKGALYHIICQGSAKSCRRRLARGDRPYPCGPVEAVHPPGHARSALPSEPSRGPWKSRHRGQGKANPPACSGYRPGCGAGWAPGSCWRWDRSGREAKEPA